MGAPPDELASTVSLSPQGVRQTPRWNYRPADPEVGHLDCGARAPCIRRKDKYLTTKIIHGEDDLRHGRNIMSIITGLHHVTINSGDPQENLDFYVGVLGMRLVKKTVNQDAPETYHLFYADGAGTPGTELTFFPWRGMPQGRAGTGATSEIALAVPSGSLPYWTERPAAHGVASVVPSVRFGEPTLTFEDPHGVALAIAETRDTREFTPWADSSVPGTHQVRGLHAVRLVEASLEPTEGFLVRGLGFELVGEEDGWRRYAVNGGGSGRIVDVRVLPDSRRAVSGVGSVHHVAFRV